MRWVPVIVFWLGLFIIFCGSDIDGFVEASSVVIFLKTDVEGVIATGHLNLSIILNDKSSTVAGKRMNGKL